MTVSQKIKNRDELGLWDGNPVKLEGCDHYTTRDVINSYE